MDRNKDASRFNLGKYRKYPEVRVWGFVVNIHNLINYDIELFLTLQLHNRYSNAIQRKYAYKEWPPSINPYDCVNVPTKEGNAYGCRIKGITMDNGAQKRYVLCAYAFIYISRLIEECGGWVICRISDMDVYRRILIDIEFPSGPSVSGRTNQTVCSYLLANYGGVFIPYAK